MIRSTVQDSGVRWKYGLTRLTMVYALLKVELTIASVMVTVQARTEDTDTANLEELKKRLIQHVVNHCTDDLKLTSLFFQAYNDMSNKGTDMCLLACFLINKKAPPDLPIEHLWGEQYIYEDLFGLRYARSTSYDRRDIHSKVLDSTGSGFLPLHFSK